MKVYTLKILQSLVYFPTFLIKFAISLIIGASPLIDGDPTVADSCLAEGLF